MIVGGVNGFCDKNAFFPFPLIRQPIQGTLPLREVDNGPGFIDSAWSGLLLPMHMKAICRRFLTFWLLAMSVWAGPAAEPPKALWYGGHEYVSLSQWAADNNFTFSWQPPAEAIHLTNRWARLAFQNDSRRVEINGVGVWLSFNIVVRFQTPYLARHDLQRTINPLLLPVSPTKPPSRIRTVALDAGHGGKDPGYQHGRRPEKEFTLQLAKELRSRLTSAGLAVCLVRSQDFLVPLEDRPLIAKRKRADLFISLHYNSVSGVNVSEVKGVETYCLTPAGANSTNGALDPADQEYLPGNRNDARNILLAYQIQKAMVRDLKAADHGVRRARWAVLRTATMPAVLVECGFLSHPDESKKINTNAYQRQTAQAIIDGILAYKRMVEK
jgi:N-acetylmuramoyl-L-alanine amidase